MKSTLEFGKKVEKKEETMVVPVCDTSEEQSHRSEEEEVGRGNEALSTSTSYYTVE